MLSTCPLTVGKDAVHKPVLACSDFPKPVKVESCTVERNQCSVPHVGDSTDVGSSSDAEVSHSSFSSLSCSDSERQIPRKGANDQQCCAVLFTPAPEARNHPMSMPMLAAESTHASTHSVQPARQEGNFRAPPGLPSPIRRRKTKPSVQSMLATTPPQDVDVSFLPATPSRRTRAAIIEKAKRDGAPVKVEPSAAIGCTTVSLDPAMPAKKRLPFRDLGSSINENLRRLKPGMPLKKCVTPWLLEDPIKLAPR